jgi:tetratricopeptide (TPR) repeat protein
MACFASRPEWKGGSPVNDIALASSVEYLVDHRLCQQALSVVNIGELDSSPELILAAATCHDANQGTNSTAQCTKALEVIARGIWHGWNLPDLIILKGRCFFRLGDFEMAREAFQEADEIKPDPQTKLWIARCEARLLIESNQDSPRIIRFEAPSSIDLKRDWYQSSAYVTLVVYASHVKQDELKVTFHDTRVDVEIVQKEIAMLRFRLEKPILPDQSRFEITPSKVEVRMMKALAGEKWKLVEERL